MTEGYKGHRLGSRVGTAHQIFDEKGPEAMSEWCLANGLAANTVKLWVSVWGKGTGQKLSSAAKVAIAEGVSIIAPKGNVKVKWSKRPARLVERGEQCSEIKWLDTGTNQALPNDQLLFKN